MASTIAAPAGTETPTKVRYGVLGFACVLSMITYLDRVCMGTVMPDIQREFGFTDFHKGWIFGAFTLAYAAFEVPTGWLGDLFGARKTLIRIVLWWSFFTVLTGLVYPVAGWPFYPFIAMLTIRFLFGIGEAGAYPNIARAFHNWFPYDERGSAKGAVWMAGRFAGGVTPLIVMSLLIAPTSPTEPAGWRHTFWIFGAIGIVWCVLFYSWYRDRPEQNPHVNAAELALIHHGGDHVPAGEKLQVPWLRLFTSPNLWYLCSMYALASFGWYFNITYLPGFLEEQFGMSKGEKWSPEWWGFTLMAGLPLLLGSLACLIGGLLTDLFIKRTSNRKWGRRLFGMVGHGLCGIFYLMGLLFMDGPFRSAWMFVLAISVATFWNDITMGAAWASCLDIGRRYSGIVAGCMNTVGNLGGFIANIVTGWILSSYTLGIDKKTQLAEYVDASKPAWTVNILLFGGVYFVAVVMWFLFDSTKPLDEEPKPVSGDDLKHAVQTK